MSISDHARANRIAWGVQAAEYEPAGRRHWADDVITWGTWAIPEASLHSLPEVDGRDVIELGCGTAYVSAWLARRGARPVGIDITPEQLATARALQAEHGLDFPLIEGSAEAVPLPDDSFDLAISEYGASLWCDPEAWIPEAARLLRPGGWLWFLTNTPLVHAHHARRGRALGRGARAAAVRHAPLRVERWLGRVPSAPRRAHRAAGPLRLHGEALHELQAPEGATTRYEWATPEWAHRWPSEEIWVARLREPASAVA